MAIQRSRSSGRLLPPPLPPQQFDFKSTLTMLQFKRPITPIPGSLSHRMLPVPSTHQRVFSWDRPLLTTRLPMPKTKPKVDYSGAILQAFLQPMKTDRNNIEKTVAKGGGFTTFRRLFQGSPGRIPRLLSKREGGNKLFRKRGNLKLKVETSGLNRP